MLADVSIDLEFAAKAKIQTSRCSEMEICNK